MKPKEIAAKAKAEHNVVLDTGYISSTRSKSKGSSGKRSAPNGSGGSGEMTFRKALQGITLDRAQEIIEEIRQAYGGG